MRHQSQCSAPWKNMMLFPYRFNCLCWKISFYYVGYCNVGCDNPLARHRESDRHGAPSCVAWPVKTMWPLGNFVLQCWLRQSWWLHDLWSKLNQEPRVAAAFVDSHNAKAKNCQINQRMNDHQSLLFCSLPVCPFSMTWQPLSFHSMLPTSSYLGTWIPFLPVIPDFPETDIWKRQNINPKSNISYVFVKSFWISLPINAKKNLWGNTFFLQSIRTVWSSIWSSTVEVPAALQVTTVCRVPSTCKDRMWDKCYGSVRLALFTASLTKKCV